MMRRSVKHFSPPIRMAYRPLSSGLAGCCKAARWGLGLPGSLSSSSDSIGYGTPRPELPDALVCRIDVLARRMERKGRLLSMNGGNFTSTLCWGAAFTGGLHDTLFLLAHGADPSAMDGSALEASCARGHYRVTRALLAAGTYSQERLNKSLWDAANHGYAAVCKLLLNYGANIAARDDYALQMAAQSGHIDTVRLLLDRGADAWSIRAYQNAKGRSRKIVVALLMERRGTPMEEEQAQPSLVDDDDSFA